MTDLSDAAGARTLSDMSDATNTADALYGEYGNRQDEFGHLSPASQAEIIEYCHTIANLMNFAKNEVRRAEVVTVTADGFEITRGMVEDEVRRTLAPRPEAIYSGPMPLVIGMNASSNMFGG